MISRPPRGPRLPTLPECSLKCPSDTSLFSTVCPSTLLSSLPPFLSYLPDKALFQQKVKAQLLNSIPRGLIRVLSCQSFRGKAICVRPIQILFWHSLEGRQRPPPLLLLSARSPERWYRWSCHMSLFLPEEGLSFLEGVDDLELTRLSILLII